MFVVIILSYGQVPLFTYEREEGVNDYLDKKETIWKNIKIVLRNKEYLLVCRLTHVLYTITD